MVSFIDNLPALVDDQFLVSIEWKSSQIIFCVRELEWHIAMDIQSESLRQNENHTYYSGEYEKRQTLKQSIIWAADLSSSELAYNYDGEILSKIEYGIMEVLWEKYNEWIEIGADEASSLYNAAKSYFSGKSKDCPIPSLVKEVDMFYKGFASMSRAELKQIKNSDMERINLISAAREEVIGSRFTT